MHKVHHEAHEEREDKKPVKKKNGKNTTRRVAWLHRGCLRGSHGSVKKEKDWIPAFAGMTKKGNRSQPLIKSAAKYTN